MKSRHTILKGDNKLFLKTVHLNEVVIRGEIKELVCGSVAETFIEMYLADVYVHASAVGHYCSIIGIILTQGVTIDFLVLINCSSSLYN